MITGCQTPLRRKPSRARRFHRPGREGPHVLPAPRVRGGQHYGEKLQCDVRTATSRSDVGRAIGRSRHSPPNGPHALRGCALLECREPDHPWGLACPAYKIPRPPVPNRREAPEIGLSSRRHSRVRGVRKAPSRRVLHAVSLLRLVVSVLRFRVRLCAGSLRPCSSAVRLRRSRAPESVSPFSRSRCSCARRPSDERRSWSG